MITISTKGGPSTKRTRVPPRSSRLVPYATSPSRRIPARSRRAGAACARGTAAFGCAPVLLTRATSPRLAGGGLRSAARPPCAMLPRGVPRARLRVSASRRRRRRARRPRRGHRPPKSGRRPRVDRGGDAHQAGRGYVSLPGVVALTPISLLFRAFLFFSRIFRRARALRRAGPSVTPSRPFSVSREARRAARHRRRRGARARVRATRVTRERRRRRPSRRRPSVRRSVRRCVCRRATAAAAWPNPPGSFSRCRSRGGFVIVFFVVSRRLSPRSPPKRARVAPRLIRRSRRRRRPRRRRWRAAMGPRAHAPRSTALNGIRRRGVSKRHASSSSVTDKRCATSSFSLVTFLFINRTSRVATGGDRKRGTASGAASRGAQSQTLRGGQAFICAAQLD